MPSQPLSSRLSLAQAVMSMGAKSKALNLGIQTGTAAEDEEWGKGQPVLKVMGRSVKIMRRWGYYDQQENNSETVPSIKQEEEGLKEASSNVDRDTEPNIDIASQETIKADSSSSPLTVPSNPRANERHSSDMTKADPPVWALDLEALRKSNSSSPLISSPTPTSTAGPIYDPHTARSYLLKSFATPPSSTPTTTTPPPPPAKLSKAAAMAKEREEKENNLARLLYALDLLFASWINVIGSNELDRRAFGWYSRVRPQVEDG
ncbi:MAG: hypothetical protein Q9224_007258 [Gallowayella concinna]